ncbi:hypothetical protein BJ508DRAFT_418407 [Ascobolus immersus RN42]|uniref:Uncharacterized protein n=1 Tax=Ascobolus immersus RN42 TaxID=1160509 RepID=A0A3N4HSP1_ASCIM|nr:hypothetical protein BJ508DRAFT_418407 [Ascobolus immersus RN42]
MPSKKYKPSTTNLEWLPSGEKNDLRNISELVMSLPHVYCQSKLDAHKEKHSREAPTQFTAQEEAILVGSSWFKQRIFACHTCGAIWYCKTVKANYPAYFSSERTNENACVQREDASTQTQDSPTCLQATCPSRQEDAKRLEDLHDLLRQREDTIEKNGKDYQRLQEYAESLRNILIERCSLLQQRDLEAQKHVAEMNEVSQELQNSKRELQLAKAQLEARGTQLEEARNELKKHRLLAQQSTQTSSEASPSTKIWSASTTSMLSSKPATYTSLSTEATSFGQTSMSIQKNPAAATVQLFGLETPGPVASESNSQQASSLIPIVDKPTQYIHPRRMDESKSSANPAPEASIPGWLQAAIDAGKLRDFAGLEETVRRVIRLRSKPLSETQSAHRVTLLKCPLFKMERLFILLHAEYDRNRKELEQCQFLWGCG